MGKSAREFGQVIAERRLHVRGAPKRFVTVSLGAPRRTPGDEEWGCPFRIRGAGIRIVEYGYGVDAMQALQTALEGIRFFLDETGLPLQWPCGVPRDTGFSYRQIPTMFGMTFARRLDRLIERELRQRLQYLQRKSRAKRRRRSTRKNSSA
jgi:hypothetical protein